MDFACSLQPPNVLRTGEGTTSYRISDVLTNSRFRYRGFGYNVFNPSMFSKGQFRRNIRRSIGYGGCLSSSLVYKRKIDSTMRGSCSNKSLFCGFDDVLNVLGGVKSQCQGNDSLAYIDGNGRNVEFGGSGDESLRGESADGAESIDLGEEETEEKDLDVPSLDELKGLLLMGSKELEVARLNSTIFEEKAQRISEAAIALKDEAANAWNDVNTTLDMIQEIVNEECVAKEAIQKATMALSLAEARLQVALESLQVVIGEDDTTQSSGESDTESGDKEDDGVLLAAESNIRECKANLENCEAELRRLQSKKEELQKEVDRLNEVAEKAQMNALEAEEDVANIMLLAEQAVAFELEAAQHFNDAEIALQKAEKSLSSSYIDVSETIKGYASGDEAAVEEKTGISDDVGVGRERDMSFNGDYLVTETSIDILYDKTNKESEELFQSDEMSDQENGKLSLDSPKEAEVEAEKIKTVIQTKKQEPQKDLMRESSPLNSPKTLLKKSSRFFSASFFSFDVDVTEFTPASVLQYARKQLPKLVLGFFLFGAGFAFYANRVERSTLQLQQPDVITTSIEEVSSNAKPFIRQIRKVNEEEASLFDMLWLLLASVIFVPLFQKIPGGSPVLGYLAAGILIGPYGLSIIRHVHGTKAIAEFGVVFLLFNIGLELSVERLSSMKKYVFGLGSAQVLVTAVVVGLVAHFVSGQLGPAAIVIGNGLALSSTAVVLQVLQERGESTSRHGRATFSVLLFQDLAVVVLLILIPLISPNSSKGGVGFQAIAEALGLAAVKAAVAITAIIAGGRLLLRPIYKQIAENQNAEIFSANTLLVILGTSLLTARAGLSMALGAFLAGLLLAETEFSLQVESDIAPYRGLLLGLFFMTVGMSIDPKLLLSNFPVIMGSLGLLIGGKTLLVALVGRLFGISIISAIRVGLLLAPGGEFAFVAFGEAVNQGIMSPQLSSLLFLVVGISMALTPWLAAGGQLIASRFEQHDVRSLLPAESETDDLQDHIIICGFGRVGQIIAQLLSERLIPFVALDVRR
ncbi:hypothetical protein EZV62_009824 [Acer yangbiense]|uniref:RCK N-terminal domain-containing protein n=1 Tax=Acer yangbiense TaxID=1000413 RepID=A0A5C7I108_9ROSI|nr:hypothetical protein EZV62_009824 [Acer yangbiense]